MPHIVLDVVWIVSNAVFEASEVVCILASSTAPITFQIGQAYRAHSRAQWTPTDSLYLECWGCCRVCHYLVRVRNIPVGAAIAAGKISWPWRCSRTDAVLGATVRLRLFTGRDDRCEKAEKGRRWGKQSRSQFFDRVRALSTQSDKTEVDKKKLNKSLVATTLVNVSNSCYLLLSVDIHIKPKAYM